MPMLKFALIDGAPIWIDPDKIVAVQRSPLRFGSGPERTGASIHIGVDNDSRWVVQESVEDVAQLNQSSCVSLVSRIATATKLVRRCLSWSAEASQNARMPKGHDFKLAPTRVTEPTGGPGAELATLEDAARFIGLMRPLRMEGGEVQSTAEYQSPESVAAVNGGQPIEAEPSEVEPSSLDAMRACIDGIGDEPKEGISAGDWEGFRLRIKDVAG